MRYKDVYIMKRNKINRTAKLKFKLILYILMVCIILSLTLNSCSQNQPPNQSIEEAEPKMLAPGEGEIIGIADDKGYDYDNKRGYEFLEVDIKVNVGERGDYIFHAFLHSKDDKTISMGNLWVGAGIDHAASVTIKKLTEGVNTVPIYFTGSNIRKMKVNGPYKVNVRMFGTSPNSLDEGDFYTSRYKYRQFSKGDDD